MTDSSLALSASTRFEHALDFAAQQVAATIERTPDYFPIYTVNGRWHHSGELWTDWTGGFFAGMMWQFHRRTGDPAWRERAEHYSRLLEHRQHDRNVHDLGFIFLNTYRPWFELTGDPRLQGVLVQAGRTLAMRFMEKGQYLRSFVAPESLFIDIMMNVPIIFYAANVTNDEQLRAVARTHCRTTRDKIVRADGSTAHEGIFDVATGEFLRESTHQGWRPDSAWARGLGWSLYGYSQVFALTGEEEFLEVAERNAQFWLANLPEDGVPWWDFRAGLVAAAPLGDVRRRVPPPQSPRVDYWIWQSRRARASEPPNIETPRSRCSNSSPGQTIWPIKRPAGKGSCGTACITPPRTWGSTSRLCGANTSSSRGLAKRSRV